MRAARSEPVACIGWLAAATGHTRGLRSGVSGRAVVPDPERSPQGRNRRAGDQTWVHVDADLCIRALGDDPAQIPLGLAITRRLVLQQGGVALGQLEPLSGLLELLVHPGDCISDQVTSCAS
jgi:hypothetical protein